MQLTTFRTFFKIQICDIIICVSHVKQVNIGNHYRLKKQNKKKQKKTCGASLKETTVLTKAGRERQRSKQKNNEQLLREYFLRTRGGQHVC